MEDQTRASSPAASPVVQSFPRIVALASGRHDALEVASARTPGLAPFDHVLLSFDGVVGSADPDLAESLHGHPAPLLRLRLDRFSLDDPLVERFPEFFAVRREAPDAAVLDPRRPSPARGQARARIRRPDLPAEVERAIGEWLGHLLARGVRGFVIDGLEARATPFYTRQFAGLRARVPGVLVIGATPGLPRGDAVALAGAGFDYLLSSFAWWDLRARWLLDEHAALAPLCPLIAEITPAGAARVADPEGAARCCPRPPLPPRA